MPSNALYLPFGAMNQNISGPRPSIGQQETVHHQFLVNSQPIATFSSAYASRPFSSGSRETPSPSPVAVEEDTQPESQSIGRKYDKWTNEQQRYLVQLWAEKQDKLNSKDSRVAWREISEMLNLKFATFKTVEKCLRKMKYLIDLYKERKEWNKNQTGGGLRKSVLYDEIDAVLGCRDVVTLPHVLETGDSTTSSSLDSDSPLNSSTESSSGQGQECSPKEPVPVPKSRLERKKGKGKKRKRDLEDDDYTERESEHFKQAIDGIKSQGERVVSCMEKMQEMQMQQVTVMNQFMGNFLQAFKDK